MGYFSELAADMAEEARTAGLEAQPEDEPTDEECGISRVGDRNYCNGCLDPIRPGQSLCSSCRWP
jgi:hypothetical protein